jgi:hypothetical protein
VTAYSDAYRALSSSRALKPAEVTRLLASVLDEHAAELAEVIRTEAKRRCLPTDTDTNAVDRRKRRRYGGMLSAAALIDPALRANPTPIPEQRNRSTS